MQTDKKIAWVTGASRGIGLAIADRLIAKGCFVVGTSTTEQGAEMLRNRFQDRGWACVLNMTDADSRQELLNKTDLHPHIMVHNAGITADDLMLRMKPESWNAVIETNLSGPYHLSHGVLKSMMRKRGGRIIYLSSIVAHTGAIGQVNYAASKSGMLGMMRSMARELASRSITVNAVSPGFIDTDMTRSLPESYRADLLKSIPAGCMGSPEDVAHVVAFLASDEAKYITGQVIHVNGGMHMGD